MESMYEEKPRTSLDLRSDAKINELPSATLPLRPQSATIAIQQTIPRETAGIF
jgi:hypothetical protein